MERIDLSTTSWLLKGRYEISPEEFEELLTLKPEERGEVVVYGQRHKIPRFQRLFGEASYSFSGVTVPGEPLEHPILIGLMDYVNSLEPGAKYNGMLVNFYMDGKDHIGPHADDEGDLVKGAPIYSFSFGATRTFRFHRKGGGKKVLDVELTDGTMVAMCGACQREFKHSIPRQVKVTTPRINITVRAFIEK